MHASLLKGAFDSALLLLNKPTKTRSLHQIAFKRFFDDIAVEAIENNVVSPFRIPSLTTNVMKELEVLEL